MCEDIGLPEIPEAILEASSNGRLVVFIGSGISQQYGLPSWNDFAGVLTDWAYKEGFINYKECEILHDLTPRIQLSIIHAIIRRKSKGGRPPYDNFLKPKKRDLHLYRDIYRFNAKYVTTNYDKILFEESKEYVSDKFPKQTAVRGFLPVGRTADDAILQNNLIAPPHYYDKNDFHANNLKNGAIFHLHGCIEDYDSMVVTNEDYIRRHSEGKENSLFRNFLSYIFAFHTVLFLGYNLAEFEIMEYIIEKNRNLSQKPRHYILFGVFQSDEHEKDFWRQYFSDFGIMPSFYYKDKCGHKILYKIIEDWANRLGPISHEKLLIEESKEINETLRRSED